MPTKDPSGMASDLASEWQTIQRLKTLMGLSWHHKWTCGTRAGRMMTTMDKILVSELIQSKGTYHPYCTWTKTWPV